jgi:hypothetical protein
MIRAHTESPGRLITRRAPLECFLLALPRPGDIKVIIDCLQ